MIFYLNNNLYLFLSNKTTGANLKLCIEEKGWKELLNIKSHLRLKTSPLYENIKLLQSGHTGLLRSGSTCIAAFLSVQKAAHQHTNTIQTIINTLRTH